MFSMVLGFFEFGAGEIMFIMLVALLLFGGDKLPELARGLGKGIRDFKDASEGIKREINNQIDTFEEKKKTEAVANERPATGAGDEHPVAADEALTVAEHPEHSMPVAEIGSTAEIEPVKPEEHHVEAEPAHLRETPIEPVKSTHE